MSDEKSLYNRLFKLNLPFDFTSGKGLGFYNNQVYRDRLYLTHRWESKNVQFEYKSNLDHRKASVPQSLQVDQLNGEFPYEFSFSQIA